MLFRIVHNGYNINYANTLSDVNAFIDSVVGQYANLGPRKILDKQFRTGIDKGLESVRIVVYKYNTLYEEVFIIEEEKIR